MRIIRNGSTVKIWASKSDTRKWANRPESAWPCSFLSGRTIFAEYDSGDLVDLAISGESDMDQCPSHEFDAFISDMTEERQSNQNLINTGRF